MGGGGGGRRESSQAVPTFVVEESSDKKESDLNGGRKVLTPKYNGVHEARGKWNNGIGILCCVRVRNNGFIHVLSQL